MKVIETTKLNFIETRKVFKFVQQGSLLSLSNSVPELTQAQAEDADDDVNFGSVSGQRLSQSIVAWAKKAASVFQGILSRYTEAGTLLVIPAGAVSVVHSSSKNLLIVPSLTQNTVITFTGALLDLKSTTLDTEPDTGGPWTLGYIANGNPVKTFVRNGSGTAELESLELRTRNITGTVELYTIDAGGTEWSK